jgi:threonine/homoserine/homoserine lactone efflux protein
MNRISNLFLYTLGVSFLGSMPLGTLNVSITNFIVQKGVMPALLFGLGAILVELLLVRLAIEGVKRLEGVKRYVAFLHWIAVAVLFFFAAAAIIAALQMKRFGATVLLLNERPFVSGLILSALNPLHLPFWLSWTAAFKAKGILHSSHREYNVYVAAIGIGTAAAFMVYGWLGTALILLLNEKQFLLNWLVGLTLFATAVLQVRKILQHRSRAALVSVQSDV